MPFTPFHVGPALFAGLLFFQFLDLPSLVISSIVLDLEGLYLVVLSPLTPHHGLPHTYIVASIIGIIVAVAMYSLKGLTGKTMEKIGLYQVSSFKKTVSSSLLGVYSHIFLDSFLYPEMNPFYPSLGNPFVGITSEYIRHMTVYGLCSLSFIIGLILYFKKRTSQGHPPMS